MLKNVPYGLASSSEVTKCGSVTSMDKNVPLLIFGGLSFHSGLDRNLPPYKLLIWLSTGNTFYLLFPVAYGLSSNPLLNLCVLKDNREVS